MVYLPTFVIYGTRTHLEYTIYMDPMVKDDMIFVDVQTAEGVKRLPESDLVEIG